jgi:outer membrane protein assembly factor BamB
MRTLKVIVWAAWVVSVSGAAEPSDTRWGGGGSPNCVSDACGLPESLEGAAPVWEVRLGSHQYSIPTVDCGRVYLGINDTGVARDGYRPNGGGAVRCVELATGRTVWELPVPRFVEGVKPPYYFDQWKCGVCSGPLVAEDRVYLVGSRGDVLCLDRNGQEDGNGGPFLSEAEYFGLAQSNAVLRASDGDILWRFDLLKELNVAPHDVCGSTVLLADGLLYVCTSNGEGRGHTAALRPDSPTLAVLDAATGRLIATDREQIGRRMFHGNWSSPSFGRVAGQGLVFFGGGDGFLYAFKVPRRPLDGSVQTLEKAWASDCNPPHYRVRDGQALAYSEWNHNRVDGPSEPIGTPVCEAGRVYVAIGQSPVHGPGNGCLTCFDAATGAVVWRTERLKRTLATVALRDGVIYLPDGAGVLHAFDAASGETLWTHGLGAPVHYASARVADGKVYVGTEAGDFWIFRAGREKVLLSQTRLPSPPITAAAADGWLLIPMQNRLRAYGK